jgi:diaminopimelate epimerase
MNARPFRKMHGLGNDFVVVDARRDPFALTPGQASRIADRRRGVGCDQVIVMEPPQDAAADLFMRIYNSDGSQAEACGNATRCVSSLVFAESGKDAATIQTLAGLLPAKAAEDGWITVDMGPAGLDWHTIPLARDMDTLHLDYECGPLRDPAAVSVGNPHVVFFVPDVDAVDLEGLGPRIEHDALFPNRTNVQIVQVIDRGRVRHRIWERGAGITQSSGSGACSVIVAAARRGVTDHRALVEQPGGTLDMAWRESDGHILMTGPVATAFSGRLDASLL